MPVSERGAAPFRRAWAVGITAATAIALAGCARSPGGGVPNAAAASIGWSEGVVHPEAGPVLSALYAPGAQNAVAWLPDGTFWNGDCEFALFDAAGAPLQFGPREFASGGLPLVRATARADGAIYEVTACMPWRGSDRESLDWTLVSVRARPESAERPPPRLEFHLATRSGGPRWHYLDARAATYDHFAYAVRGRRMLRDGHAIAEVAGPGIAAERPAPAAAGGLAGDRYAAHMTGRAPVRTGGAVEWRVWIAPPGGAPAGAPPPEGTRSTAEILGVTVEAWRREMALGAVYEIPDPEAQRVLDASHALLVGTRTRRGGNLLFPGSVFQYRDYYVRDGARVARALDLWGRHDLARALVYDLFDFQWPSGVILSQRGQLDGTGQALWALGQHTELAGDTATVDALLPAALRATDWIRFQRQITGALGGRAAGLLPCSDPKDNENLQAHLLGSDAWALAGLEATRRMATQRGQSAAAESLRTAATAYEARLLQVFDEQALRQGRPLPPAVERGAREWGNWSAAYPCAVVAPTDARAMALDRFVRGRYFVDGLPTIAGRDALHCYVGFDLTQAALRRDERGAVLADFAADVRHTQCGGGGLEVVSHRHPDYGENLPPHTTFAAGFTDLVRSMLLYESGDSLVLLAGTPASWFATGGAGFRATRAPTRFGPVDCLVRRTAPRTLQLDVNLPVAGRVQLPRELFVEAVHAEAPGAVASRTGDHDFTLPAGAGAWTVRLGAPRTGDRGTL
jgi:hypothetical protein